jgi:hypothetical protein
MILIGKRGRIIKGPSEGWYILVQDDTANTGGYYILTSSNPGFSGGEGFDDWVENRELLERLFETSNWVIEWES